MCARYHRRDADDRSRPRRLPRGQRRGRRLESLFELAAHPQRSRPCPSTPPTCRRAAEWIAAELTRGSGSSMPRSSETGGHPIVYGDWLHAEGAPTVLVYGHYDVQPVDPLDLWEIAAVRAVRSRRPGLRPRRRPTTRARSTCTSRRPRRCSRRAAALPVNLKLHVRGRGGVGSSHLDELAARPIASASRRTPRSSATRASSRATCPRSRPRPARACMYAQIDVDRPADRPPLRRLRRRRPEPGQRAGRRSSPRSRARMGGSASRASTTTSRPLARRGAARDQLPAVRRGGVPARDRRARAGRASRATRRWSGAAPGRPSTSTASGAASGRGHEDDHPGPRPRQGQLPARARPGPRRGLREASATTSRQIAPPGVTVDGPEPRRPPSLHADRPPGDPGRGARARGDVRAGSRCSSARAARSRSRRASRRSSGCRSCCSASRQPDDNAHAPNEWMVLVNYETGIRTIVRLWDELAARLRATGRLGEDSGECRSDLGGTVRAAVAHQPGATMHPTRSPEDAPA